MNIPDPILAYFEAANAGDGEAAVSQFSEDAVVHDENADHRGREAIRAWIEETTQKYRPQTEILGVDERDGRPLAIVRVSGEFPGSPVELDFAFTLDNGMISYLDIR